MSTVSSIRDEPIPNQDIEDIKNLLWGKDIKYDVFRRWTQGIVFSDDEPTALTQLEGGPCAVIAPLQAFLLKQAMFSQNLGNNWRDINEEQRKRLLCASLAEMLSLVSSSETSYLVLHRPHDLTPEAATHPNVSHINPTHPAKPAGSHQQGQADAETNDHSNSPPNNSSSIEVNSESKDSKSGAAASCNAEMSASADSNSRHQSSDDLSSGSSPKKKCLSHEEFHLSLRCRKCNSREELLNQLELNISELYKEYGVLLLLYSVILTKGLDQIKKEVEDPGEALIDGTYGHGSQSLINLLITGKAVSNVWDNDKDLSGLTLHGITTQSTIGFLTLLEHLRYCEVGWYLKNPKVPVWLLGSETHITVLFSKEKSLVALESPEAEARRLFCNFDTEGRGFIPCDHLQDLMAQLNLVSEIEYVKIMQEKLDPEQLGIVTLNSFMEEFFPNENQPDMLTTFVLMHYNGLGRSCPSGKVQYCSGEATIQEMPEVQIITDTSAMKTCLMTKWPTIDLKWTDHSIPSLN